MMWQNQNWSSKSVSYMPAVCTRCFTYPVSHWVDEGVDLSQRHVVIGNATSWSNPSVKFVQSAFYGAKDRAVRWPIKWNHVCLGEEVTANSSDMRPGIILLKCQIVLLHKRTTHWRRLRSLYWTEVKFPLTTIRGVLSPWAVLPHSITEPPPNLSVSTTQALTSINGQSLICLLLVVQKLCKIKTYAFIFRFSITIVVVLFIGLLFIYLLS